MRSCVQTNASLHLIEPGYGVEYIIESPRVIRRPRNLRTPCRRQQLLPQQAPENLIRVYRKGNPSGLKTREGKPDRYTAS